MRLPSIYDSGRKDNDSPAMTTTILQGMRPGRFGATPSLHRHRQNEGIRRCRKPAAFMRRARSNRLPSFDISTGAQAILKAISSRSGSSKCTSKALLNAAREMSYVWDGR
jgi:hypothetical protein